MNGSKTFKVLLALALVLAVVGVFTPRATGDPLTPFAYQTKWYITSGGDKAVVASGGELEVLSGGTVDSQSGATVGFDDVTFNGTNTHTLGAADKVRLDGNTTNQTQTAGALDVDVGTVTANVSGFNVAVTTDDGTTAATDVFGGVMTLTQNDADADMFGLKITAAATANAGANSYEYGLLYDCAENTAGACPDGILLTSSGANTGMTDAVDASATNIVNAINIGANLILGGDESVSIGATDDTLILKSNDATATFMGADAAGAADTIYDTTGAGAITVGSADVTGVTVTTDGTGDAELAVPENSIGPDEMAVMVDQVIFCGEADENGTIYYGPATAVFGGDGSASYAISTVACDALDNATEATADAPIMTNVAFKVVGLFCKQSGTLGAGEAVTLTVRSAAADTTPAISCIISEGETDCRSLTGSTTDIAAGATIAVKAVQSSDNADDDHWCKVYIAYK